MEKYTIDSPDFLTDEQVDALMDDWFDRDGDTYIHKRKEGRLEWEKDLAGDSAYSEWMLSAPTEKELITRAYSLGRDTLVAMDLPTRVRVRISKMDSCTNGKIVYLATQVFDEKGMDTSEKLDVFLGTAVHEGCHILWTDFKAHPDVSRLCRTLENIIEDERIEQICGDERPGFANFLEKLKAYYFGLYYKRVTEKYLEERGSLLEKFIDMFLKIIRYPKYIDEILIIKFYKYLVRIKEILTPYPTSTLQSFEAAVEIEKVIYEFYADEMTKEEKRKDAERGEGDSGKGDSGEGATAGEDTGVDTPKKESRKFKPDDEEVRRWVAHDSEREGFKDTIKTFSPDSGGPSTGVSKEILEDSEFAEVVEGSITLGSSRDVIFTRAEAGFSAEANYKASLDRVRRFIPAIAKILKAHALEYRYVLRGMRSGRLDTGKLAEAFQGVPTVYLREGEVKTDRISVCLLVDESGSMSGKREVAARDTAVLINEAIGGVPNVDLFIYGHTGDTRRTGTTEISVYREHGFDSRKALGNVSARCENRDGTAILETARRVRKQTKENVLMFVISDGTPAARGYIGESAITHTRKAVSKVESMGFSVVQICINPVYDPGRMFKHFVILNNMETLSLDLSKVIKNSLLKITKRKAL